MQILTKRSVFILSVFCLLGNFFTQNVQAAQTFKDSYWESKALPETILSLAWADLNQDYYNDIITLSKKIVTAYRLDNGNLVPLATLKATHIEEFHRVSAGDWDQNGVPEILVVGLSREQIFTRIYALSGNQFVLKQEFDELVQPLNWQGNVSLFAQKMRGNGKWAEVIEKLSWQKNQFVPDKKTNIKQGIGGDASSLFQYLGFDQYLLELTGDGGLRVTDANARKVWQSGLNYGGAVDYTLLGSKDPLGMSQQTRYFIEPRLLYDSVSKQLVAIKNDGYLKSVIGAVPNMKSTQLSTLSWTGSSFQEGFTWPRLDGAITDVQMIDFDQNGTNEILLSFLVRNSGYFDSMTGQGSIIAVIPIPQPAADASNSQSQFMQPAPNPVPPPVTPLPPSPEVVAPTAPVSQPIVQPLSAPIPQPASVPTAPQPASIPSSQ